MRCLRSLRTITVIAAAFGAGVLASESMTSAIAAERDDRSPDRIANTMTPGTAHTHLDAFVGTWDASMTILSEDGVPVVLEGTVEREWVLGRRFVRETVDAHLADGRFRGLGFIGHDNLEGRYELLWMDNQSTAMAFEYGLFDADRRLLTTRGEHRDAETGRIVMTRSEVRMSDDDRHEISAWVTDASGREQKRFEGVFERRR